jgi:hypothetical protein
MGGKASVGIGEIPIQRQYIVGPVLVVYAIYKIPNT